MTEKIRRKEKEEKEKKVKESKYNGIYKNMIRRAAKISARKEKKEI